MFITIKFRTFAFLFSIALIIYFGFLALLLYINAETEALKRKASVRDTLNPLNPANYTQKEVDFLNLTDEQLQEFINSCPSDSDENEIDETADTNEPNSTTSTTVIKNGKVILHEVKKGDKVVSLEGEIHEELPKHGADFIVSQPLKSETIFLEGTISPVELSNFISEKVIELFQNNTTRKETITKETDLKYIVQKVYNDSDLKTDLKTCNSEEEAVEYIRSLQKNYPDWSSTCHYVIKIV